MNQPVTPKLNSNKCSDPEIINIYRKSCEQSKNADKCTQNLSTFCNNYLSTEKDFKVLMDLLSCYNQNCQHQPNETCMNYCSSNTK